MLEMQLNLNSHQLFFCVYVEDRWHVYNNRYHQTHMCMHFALHRSTRFLCGYIQPSTDVNRNFMSHCHAMWSL